MNLMISAVDFSKCYSIYYEGLLKSKKKYNTKTSIIFVLKVKCHLRIFQLKENVPTMVHVANNVLNNLSNYSID